jgi:hypothetical protein
MKTIKARRVLNDAVLALKKFEDHPSDVDFRHLVVLCSTLIRTVGHVLKDENSDKNCDDTLQVEYFRTHISNQPLFTDFIKNMRDSLVKEYSADIGWASITGLDGRHRMEYILKSGTYEGRDFRDLMNEAISFWDYHLFQMEKNNVCH